VTSRKQCWLSLFETEYLTGTDTGNILPPPTRPQRHTQTHPQSGYVPWILSNLL
jgi:hypothetical protein